MAASWVSAIAPQYENGHGILLDYPHLYLSYGTAASGVNFQIKKFKYDTGTLTYVASTVTGLTYKIADMATDGTYIYGNAQGAWSVIKYTTALTYVDEQIVGGFGRDILYQDSTDTVFGTNQGLVAISTGLTALSTATQGNTTLWGLVDQGDIIAAGEHSADYGALVVAFDWNGSDSVSTVATHHTGNTGTSVYYGVDGDGNYLYAVGSDRLDAYHYTGSAFTFVATGFGSVSTAATGNTNVCQDVYCYGGKIYVATKEKTAGGVTQKGKLEVFTFNGSTFTNEQSIDTNEEQWVIDGDSRSRYFGTAGSVIATAGYAGDLFRTDLWAPMSVSVGMTM